jgi:hypothetical protein
MQSSIASVDRTEHARVLRVLFDPSILLQSTSFARLVETLPHLTRTLEIGHEFFVPGQFASIIRQTERTDRILRFFYQGKRPTPLSDVLTLLEKHKISAFTASGLKDVPWRLDLGDVLRFEQGEYLHRILLEEWTFLQTQSWILSRTRKTFDIFIRAGGAAIEVSGRTMDRLVRRSLKASESQEIYASHRLRALGKWVAVGGPPMLNHLDPGLATLAGIAGGLFLLLDP